MFEHSVKVPRHYKVAANIFQKVSTEGGSVKTLLYDDKLRHYRTNVLFALITETIKHASVIDSIFESCKLLEKESRLDPWLAKVLTSELLFGKKALPGKSKPEQTILSYKEQFEKYTSEHEDDLKIEVTRRPRYVRINTNLLTTSDAIGAFQDEGYRFIRCPSGSYNDYLKQIQNLTEYDFTQDFHVKTMFVFTSGTKLHDHDLYLDNKIILQDKATAMAVHLLAPPAGSVVLDMCAAPGMKTTQLAAYIRNSGKIYAVERNEKRFQTLCDFVTKTGSECVTTLHKDALEIKRGEMDEVEYILLDPSCSGSGMDFCVHNYIESSRLAKLTSLQEKFLKHAMNSFPNAKRIVYSTCSIFPEENERVITNVVKTSRAKWRVQDVKELLKEQWNNFGSAMYGSMGTRCMYAKPDSDLTTGFFLAVLDRDQKDMEKGLRKEESGMKREKKKNKRDSENLSETLEEKLNEEVNEVGNETGTETSKTAKKKYKTEETDLEVNESVTDDTEEHKKKKKKRKSDENDLYNVSTVTETLNDLVVESQDEGTPPKKKKKKDKLKEIDNMSEANVHIQDETNTEDLEVTKKKKKKKKRKKNEDLEISIDEAQLTDIGNNIDKNKRSKSSNTEDSMICVTDEPKKKKKMKTKDITE